MRKAFTLMEMIVSISILSIMMLFLYESYASLNHSNAFYKKEADLLKIEQLKKRVIFLDFTLASAQSIEILSQDTKEDVIFLQSSNSMHNRYKPYIAYIMKDSKLYRLESLNEFKTYPLDFEDDFSVECFGKVDSFRVYKSQNNENSSYLIHIDFKEAENILIKVKVLH